MANAELSTFTSGEARLPSLVPDEPPVILHYFDSQPGRVRDGGPYTTLIAVHGSGFNSAIWTSILPCFGSDVRLLACNRRGYSGSSGISTLSGSAVGGEIAGQHVLDLLGFVKFAAEELRVPPKDENGKGGIVLLGWSRACIFMIGLLTVLRLLPLTADPPFGLPTDLKSFHPFILSHLRAILLFEPPGNAVGIPPPAPASAPARKPSDSEIANAFLTMVKGTVPPQFHPLLDAAWEEGPVALELQLTLANDMTSVEVIAIDAFEAAPSLTKVALIYGTKTLNYCIQAASWIEQRLAGQPNTAVRVLPDTGHFAMVTHPSEFAACVQSLLDML